MSTDPYKDTSDRRSTVLIKEKEKKVMTHPRHHDSIMLTSHDSAPQKPSARNTPMLSFQPHHTEISTDRPSVSGRLLLHIPRIAGKKFHFVSLTLHLRLRESIGWSRQDLITFEIEKQSWSQTVWEKKISLQYQDRQVEEEDVQCVAVVKEPSKHNSTIEIMADEWRWEWLMPVTKREVCPESFEGSMGNVWYELEAKCMFRWDSVDKYGNAIEAIPPVPSLEATAGHTVQVDRVESHKPAEVYTDTSKKSLSFSSAFGKLRIGSKSKKAPHSGDFKVGSQHDEFIQRSLRMRNNSMVMANAENKPGLLAATTKAQSTPHLVGHPPDHSSEPLPFLIRKTMKLYFIKPPPNTSPGCSFFLPPPSMALPTLPGTRRLKAIIPGARIQVQIQIPSLIPIRGYAQTSQLVPDKKGGLVLSKHSQNHVNNLLHHQHLLYNGNGWEVNSGYLDNFQVALTVRKVTRKDIEKNNLSKKAHQNGSSHASPFASGSNGDIKTETTTASQKKHLASCVSNSSPLANHSGAIDSESAKPEGAKAATGSERSWRKEIRVRKVKCEFWQKESCRIPSSSGSPDGLSRSIKYPLGPAFSYSEKEQERERSRLSMQILPQLSAQQQQHGPIQSTATAVSWDSSVVGGGSNPARKDSNAGMPLSPILKHSTIPQLQSSAPTTPLQVPTGPFVSDRKGSSASLFTPSMHYSQTISGNASPRPNISEASKPFMLLIPVPLDSPKLRQSFVWPTADAPAPQSSKHFDPSSMPMPKSLSSSIGANYPSQKALYEMALMGTAADTAMANAEASGSSTSGPTDSFVADTFESPEQPSIAHHRVQKTVHTSVRSRIEVKHYLGLRLSIDMIEFEGELEHDDDMDLEAMEEQQLQQVKNRQELSAYRLSTGPGAIAAMAAGVGNQKDYVTQTLTSPAVSSATVPKAGVITPATPSSIAAANSTIQPALTFLNSTAGLRDLDSELDEEHSAGGSQRGHGGSRGRGGSALHQHNSRPSRSNSSSSLGTPPHMQQPLVGAVYDLENRRGSEASQATVKSADSNNNGNSNSNNQSSSALSSGGLVANAISTIKKKASASGLNAMMNAVTGHHNSSAQQQPPVPVPTLNVNAHQLAAQVNRRPRSSAMNVQKLKDFVIRVPITVVIQVDDLSCVGTTAKTDNGDTTTTEITETIDGSQGSEMVEVGWGTEMERIVTGLGSEYKSTTTLDSTDAGMSSHGPSEIGADDGLVRQKSQRMMPQGNVTEAFITPGHGDEEHDEDAEYVEGQFMADHE
ncbi:hypothetical protein BGX26_011340 [Mortierella sp. AD094]|nr:hypothetical protein BGX26_011340 [Mortierella sp. AD094]